MKEVKKASKKPGISPLGDRVLIREEETVGERLASGIIIPETVSEDKGAKSGTVVAVGPGRYEDGKIIPTKVKEGETVLFQWGDKIKIEDTEYYIVSESSILAVIK